MKKIFTIAIFALGLVGTTKAQKIAVISADEVFSKMKETKAASESLEKTKKELDQLLVEMENELNEQYARFVTDSGKMSPAIKDSKKKTLQKNYEDLQKKQQETEQQLEEEKKKLLAPIQEKMTKTIETVAKENGFEFVAYKEQFIVTPSANDITDKVKAKLGIKDEVETPAAPAKPRQ